MISFEGVSFGYGRRSAGGAILDGLSAEIRGGSVTMLTGPNGSGKSTLLRVAAGTVEAWSGAVRIDGDDAAKLGADERARRTAYVPQTREIPDVTVGRLVLAGRFPHTSFPHLYSTRDREIAGAAMERLGIWELSERNVAELSGGQRQKAFLAMAVAQEAPNLLLDEPLTHLDIRQQLELVALVRSLAEEGRTVLMVVHDLPLALSSADRLLVLDGGKIAADGSPKDVAASGAIDRVFGVRTEKAYTRGGERYFFSV